MDNVPIAKIKKLRHLNSLRSNNSSKDSSEFPTISMSNMKTIKFLSNSFKSHSKSNSNSNSKLKRCLGKSEPEEIHPIMVFKLIDGKVEKVGRFCECSMTFKSYNIDPQLTIRRSTILQKHYKPFKNLYVLLSITENGEEYYFSFSIKEISKRKPENCGETECVQCGRF